MTDTRQKFDKDLAPNDTSLSTKALKVDEVIETKESLQSAAQALSQGKMPTTEQMTEVLDSAQDAKPLRSEVNLSATGERVADKLDNVLDSTKQLIQEKNDGDVIQKLIHHSKIAAQNLDNDTSDITKGTKDPEQLLQRAYSNMVVISKLAVSSTEFRSLLSDSYNFVRDVLKEHVPGAEHLPEADDLTNRKGEFDADKAKKASKESADKITDEAYSKLDPEAKNKVDQARKADSNDVEREGSRLADKAAQKAGEALKPVTDKAARGDTKEAGQEINKGMDRIEKDAQGYAQKAKVEGERLYNEAGDTLEKVKDDLTLSDEQQENLVNRLLAIVNEIQGNKEAQRAMNGLLEILSDLQRNAQTISNRAQKKVSAEVDGNKDLQEAAKNAQKAVENFAGNHSLDKSINLLYEFSDKIQKDEKLKQVMHDNYEFLSRSIKDAKFIKEKDYSDKAASRFNKSRDMLLKRYRKDINELMSETQSFVRDLREDPTTNKAVKDLEGLTQELFLDSNGRPTIKYDLLQDFQKFIPVIAKRLELLEIPKISEFDDDNEYILDNIKLSCSNILPKTVRVRTDTEFDTEEERVVNAVSVRMQGIQAAAREVAFYYKKKMLIMNMEDAGLVDVLIPNEGMDIFLKLAPPVISSNPADKTPENQRSFRVLESRCRINEIDVRFQNTKFGAIYKIFNRMIQNNVKRDIEKMVGEGIRNFFEGAEQMMATGVDISAPNMKLTSDKPLDTRPDGWKSDAFDVKK